MSTDIIVAIIQIVPSVLWVLFVAILVALFHGPIRKQLLPRLTGFEVFGVEATFMEERMDRAIARRRVRVSEDERAGVLRRLRSAAGAFRGAAVLWVDAAPGDAADERAMLRHAGASVDLARTSGEARALLSEDGYDAVIARVAAGADPTPALEILAEAGRSEIDRHLILYVPPEAEEHGTPPGAFATANRPDRLLHYVVDVLERRRCKAASQEAR
ncbi:MAG TPA: hypothetical protein VLS89_11800 [Candidatus Nanopelagicales bacterium]|nr:hypothetical protein [Candidatus Nanopelagicales bacterium]